MSDYKNIFLAWASTASSIFAAVEMKTVMTIISAVVLPVIFFTIGKTVDVAVQVFLKRREERRGPGESEGPHLKEKHHEHSNETGGLRSCGGRVGGDRLVDDLGGEITAIREGGRNGETAGESERNCLAGGRGRGGRTQAEDRISRGRIGGDRADREEAE